MCSLLQFESVRKLAGENLILMQNKKWDGISKDNMISFLNVFGGICNKFVDLRDIRVYEFQQQLCNIYVMFGKKNVTSFTKKDDSILSKYFSLLIKFSEHPSLKICHITSQLWRYFLQLEPKKNIQRLNCFNGIAPKLLNIVSLKMWKEISDPENTRNVNLKFN